MREPGGVGSLEDDTRGTCSGRFGFEGGCGSTTTSGSEDDETEGDCGRLILVTSRIMEFGVVGGYRRCKNGNWCRRRRC